MSKAKNTPRRRGKAGTVKGAVLIMILAVMVVLIIMLAGAMAIASTAGNRAINRYEESQAYYSARSGLDLVTNILMTDAVHQDKNNSNDGNNSKAANAINAAHPSQGLVLQEAIVGKLVTDASGNVKYDTSKSLTVAPTDASGKIKENDTKTKTSYMKFDVKDMNTANDGTSGLFSDQKDGSIEVKIQLLELVYDDGGTGIERNTVTSSTAVLNNGDEKSQYIMSCKIKVSCTAEYLGNSSTVSVVLSPYVNQKSAAEGVVSTGAVNMSTNSNVLGGSVSAKGFTWGNDGTVYGNIFINGNASLNAQKTFVLRSDESFCINGDFTIQNISSLKVKKTSNDVRPFVFINGTFRNASQSFPIGDSTDKADLIARNIDFDGNGIQPKVSGNTYIDGYLKLNNAGSFNSSNPAFAGDLYISDRGGIQAVTAGGVGVGEIIANLAPGSYPLDQKTRLGAISNITMSASGFDLSVELNDPTNGANYLMSDIANNGGDGFCGGKIYYYFYEKYLMNAGVDTIPHEYYGCFELEAIRRFIANCQYITNGGGNAALYSTVPYPSVSMADSGGNPRTGWVSFYIAHQANFDKFYNKLVPLGPDPDGNGVIDNDSDRYSSYTIKYIIQLATQNGRADETPAFVDKIKFKAAGGMGGATFAFDSIEDDPTYQLYISLPWHETNSNTLQRSYISGDPKKFSKALSIPTLLSKYAGYYFINVINKQTGALWLPSADPNVFLSMGAGGTVTEITNFEYRDSNTDTYKNANWTSELGTIANSFHQSVQATFDDAVALGSNDAPGQLVNRAWDILNALYKVDTNSPPQTLTTKNVEYMSPALIAHMESGINFTLDASGKMDFSSVGNITDTDNPNMTFRTLTPANVQNQMVTVNTSSNECIVLLNPGNYQNGKLVISGANYCYILLAGPGQYNFEKFGIYTEDFNNVMNTAPGFRVGASNAAYSGYLKIKAPKIMIYADDGVEINMRNNNTTIMGYMYGPSSTLNASTPCGVSKNVLYEGTHINNVSLDFIGSAFVGDINVCNNYSFVYVPPEDEADPGTPTITWRPSYYTNQDIVEFSS
ncbi:MAG: hypothetical protein NC120_05990 [Ruminococcus sp.]|nr:hypothetical protein [Ruminococcus sp.]